MLLPDAISFIYPLSVCGLNQLEILEATARADDTYGEVAKEFQSIVRETEYVGTDYRNAIREQAMVTPSEELSQFLSDMLSIVNSGGSMEGFLDDKKEKHLRILTRHYFAMFGPDFGLPVHHGLGGSGNNRFNMANSGGVLRYDTTSRGGSCITYLHVTENNVTIELN